MSKGNSRLFSGTYGARAHAGRIIPGKEGIVKGGSSVVLGNNMLRKMGVKANIKWSGYQAQHVIPAQMRDHPVLQKMGMNLDDASNGIFLRIPSNHVSAQSRHRGYHKVYSDFVRSELDRINVNHDSLTIQKQVRSLQTKLVHLQRSGLPLYSSEGATISMWRKYMNKIK